MFFSCIEDFVEKVGNTNIFASKCFKKFAFIASLTHKFTDSYVVFVEISILIQCQY